MLKPKEEGNVSFLFVENDPLSRACLGPDAAFNSLLSEAIAYLLSLYVPDYWFMSK